MAHAKLRKPKPLGGVSSKGAGPYAGGKEYKCDHCGKTWKGKSGLWSHRNQSPCAELKALIIAQGDTLPDGKKAKKAKRAHTCVGLEARMCMHCVAVRRCPPILRSAAYLCVCSNLLLPKQLSCYSPHPAVARARACARVSSQTDLARRTPARTRVTNHNH